MKYNSLHYFVSDREPAMRLSRYLDIPAYAINIHNFPDKESKIQVCPAKDTAIIYISLNNPDQKLVHLGFAASALRDCGVTKLILVAPYLCYMRQDKAFHPGEAVSQRVISGMLDSWFDNIITVDPHLHRIKNLQEIFSQCHAVSLSATGPIYEALKKDIVDGDRLLVGPDSESEQWVKAIAEKIDVPFIVAKKLRLGDRNVAVELPDDAAIEGIHAVIVDDVISSGKTIISCANLLKSAGAVKIEVVATHILSSDDDLQMIRQAGVTRIRSTDSVHHSTNTIHLASLLAEAVKKELRNDRKD